MKKGTEYLLNPNLFSQAKLDLKPSLKTIEPHKLEMLIEEDIKYNGQSKIGEINSRLPEIPESDIRKILYKMVKEQRLLVHGGKRNRSYELAKKK